MTTTEALPPPALSSAFPRAESHRSSARLTHGVTPAYFRQTGRYDIHEGSEFELAPDNGGVADEAVRPCRRVHTTPAPTPAPSSPIRVVLLAAPEMMPQDPGSRRDSRWSTSDTMAATMASSSSRRQPSGTTPPAAGSHRPGSSASGDVSLCVCKAGVRGSIPLVSTGCDLRM